MVSGIVAPSILSCDFAHLAQECSKLIDDGADWLHVDIMDGHFVPNLTLGPPILSSLTRHVKGFFDVHCMVSNPEKWISQFASSGANSLTFHLEAASDPLLLAKEIKAKGMRAGVAIKPKTELSELSAELLTSIDMVLIMTVEPGFGGQSLIIECLEKVRQLRSRYPDLDIQVDGGVGLENISDVVDAGANIIVAGTRIVKSSSPKQVIDAMHRTLKNKFK